MSKLKKCVLSVSIAALASTASAQCDPEVIGSLAGQVGDIVRVGDLVYSANFGGGLVIYDVSDMTNPFVVGELKDCGDPIGVAVADNFAYLASPGDAVSPDVLPGLVVVDISDPASPFLVSNLPLPGRPRDLAIVGDHVFIGGDDIRLTSVDVSDPANPQVVATDLLYPRDLSSVVADDNRVFATDFDEGLVIFDVSDPMSPTVISTTFLGNIPADVEISRDGDTAFVGTYNGTVVVIDVSNPAAPAQLSSTAGFVSNMNGIDLDGDRLYGFGISRSGVMDVSNLAAPAFINRLLPTPGAFGVEGLFDNGVGLIAGAYGGLLSVDFSDPQAPIELARVRVLDGAGSIRRLGDVSYVRSGGGTTREWAIVDTSMPSSPVLVGVLPNSRALAIEGIVGTLSNVVYDFTDPLSPTEIGQVAGLPYAGDAEIRAGLGFYVAESSVYIADLSTPASAAVIGQLDLGRSAEHLALQESVLAVAANIRTGSAAGGLSLVDVSEPGSPLLLATVGLPSIVDDVEFVSNELVGVLAKDTQGNDQALVLFDISNPTAPVQAGALSLQRDVRNIDIVNGFIAVRGEPFGLDLIDVSNPASPSVAVHIPVPGFADYTVLDDGVAHIGARSDGYLIVDLLGCLPQPGCAGDISGLGRSPDGIIDFEDFMAMLGLIGECPGGMIGCLGDIADNLGTLNSPDGTVDFGDFLALLALVGACP